MSRRKTQKDTVTVPLKAWKFLLAGGVVLFLALTQPIPVWQGIIADLFQTETIPESDLAYLDYDGVNQVIEVNNNEPTFTEEELSLKFGAWQEFSDIDSLNRVGTANAMLHTSLFPTEEREPLYVNPTGWKQKKLENGQWLYNRSHLIGFQLTGENNNLRNLMTGTRSLNSPHMLLYENDLAYYLETTGHHVRYRVEPVFRKEELVARGVHLMAQSVEDDELRFNVYIFNIQDGYSINYEDGTSKKVIQ